MFTVCCVSAAVGQSVHRLLAVQAFRPDRFIAAAHQFVGTVLVQSFMQQAEQVLCFFSAVHSVHCLSSPLF